MTVLIISIIFCMISVFVALYGYKRHIQATEKLKRAEEKEQTLRRLLRGRPCTYRAAIDKSCVTVCGRYYDGDLRDVVYKEFYFDPTDSEDKEFAIREAEELIENLREK